MRLERDWSQNNNIDQGRSTINRGSASETKSTDGFKSKQIFLVEVDKVLITTLSAIGAENESINRLSARF